MNSFYMPVRVLEGKDIVISSTNLLKKFGKIALLVTGKHSAKANGSYNDVITALDNVDIEHILYDDIEENPSVETIMKARDLALRQNVDFVIGIGGGSPLDAAKAISLMIYHKDEDKDYLYKTGSDSSHVPLVLIPTTCGSGSEATAVSVLTLHEKQTKKSISHLIFAELALIDGKYLMTLPHKTLCSTAIDAFTHMVESYINTKASDYSNMCVEKGLLIWSRSLDVLRGSRELTIDDCDNLMRASMMGGMSIAQCGTTIPHGLSYSLTYKKHIAHGMAVGYFTAGYLAKANQIDAKHILNLAGFKDVADYQSFFTEIYKACDIPDIDDDVLYGAVEDVLKTPVKLEITPYEVSRQDLIDIAFYSCYGA